MFGEELESAGPERARGVQGGEEGVVVVLPVWSVRPPIMQGQWNNLNKGGGTNQPAAHGNAHAPANGQRKRLYSYSVESAE